MDETFPSSSLCHCLPFASKMASKCVPALVLSPPLEGRLGPVAPLQQIGGAEVRGCFFQDSVIPLGSLSLPLKLAAVL